MACSITLASSRTLPGQRVLSSSVDRLGREELRRSAFRLGRKRRKQVLGQGGMSPVRSRRRGRWISNVLMRIHQVFAEIAVPRPSRAGRGAWRRPRAHRPRTARCRRRGESRRFPARAAAWPASLLGSSPISSRKIVPPLATSNRPTRCSSAPVNAPLRWPNSSLSIRVSGSAPQLTATNGLSARRLCSMHGPGDQLLAGAGFAQDQHGGIGRRDLCRSAACTCSMPRLLPTSSRLPFDALELALEGPVLCSATRACSATRLSSASSSTSLQGLVR